MAFLFFLLPKKRKKCSQWPSPGPPKSSKIVKTQKVSKNVGKWSPNANSASERFFYWFSTFFTTKIYEKSMKIKKKSMKINEKTQFFLVWISIDFWVESALFWSILGKCAQYSIIARNPYFDDSFTFLTVFGGSTVVFWQCQPSSAGWASRWNFIRFWLDF